MKNSILTTIYYAVIGLFLGIPFGYFMALFASVCLAAGGLILASLVILPSGILGINTYSDKMKVLLEERSGIEKKMNDLLEKEDDLTEAEETDFDNWEKRCQDIDVQLERYKKMEERNKAEAARAGKPVTTETQDLGKDEKRNLSSFSFIKFLREAKGQSLTGIEAEMDQEARKEARGTSNDIKGFGIPSIILGGWEKRDMTADGGSSGSEGGVMVPAIKTGFIDLLRAKLVVDQLGATVLTGLSGDVDIPRMTAGSLASWKGEVVTAVESSPTFDQLQLVPKRLTTFVDVSNQLLIQASYDVENLVKNDLAAAVAQAIETAAINGSGSGAEPTGILNTSGIGAVAGGTNGLAPTYAHITQLEEEIAVDNADFGSLAYLTNPKVRRQLKNTGRQASGVEGNFIWVPDSKELNGYGAGVSTLVPSDLDKGTSTGVCSAIIFGNWNDLVIGQWAGLDILVNPYTKAKTAQVEVIVHSFNDIGVRHAESFAAMQDALTA